MRGWLVVFVLCGCLLAGVTPLARDIPSDEFIWDSGPYFPESNVMFRANNTLVEVPTVVRDRSERPVAGLTKEDFQLFDDGRPQIITSFSVLSGTPANPTDAARAAPGLSSTAPVEPRYVALFLDDVNTPGLYQDAHANLAFAREAAEKFIRQGLDPGEHIGLFTVSGDLTVDFTDDADKLLAAVAKLRLKSRHDDQAAGACPVIEAYQAWAIHHYGELTAEFESALRVARRCPGAGDPWAAKALVRRVAEEKTMIADIWEGNTLSALGSVIHHLGEMPGRRMLVLASSGFVTLSFRQRQQRVIDAATSSKVIINSLNTTGLPVNAFLRNRAFRFTAMNAEQGGVGNPNNSAMADIAFATGGLFYHNNNDLATGFHELAKAPVSYVLGYSPENLKSDGNYHHLKVKLVEGAHRSVDARPGYYAPGGDPSKADNKADKLNRSVTSTDDLAELPIVLTANASEPGSLKVVVHVDAARLPYKSIGGRHTERLVFVTALFDQSNRFLSAVEGVMQLQLKDETMQKVSAHGFDANLSISAPKGQYRVRQVVQEIEAGRVASLNREVEIR